MKKILFILTAIVLSFNGTKAQINMTSNGFVKIGSTAAPTKNIDVSGNTIFSPIWSNGPIYGSLILDNTGYYGCGFYPSQNLAGSIGKSGNNFSAVYSQAFVYPSDIRIKENIKDIKNALDIVLKLKGVRYDIKKGFAYNDSLVKNPAIKAKLEANRKDRVGFIAEDVNKILPAAVIYDDSADFYSMDYSKVVPILVEAIKQMESQIDSLKRINKKTTGTISSAKITTSSTEITTGIEDNNIQNDKPSLYQNAPNPFSQKTAIGYYLPETIQNATIYIYDMNGGQIKSIPIYSKGTGNIIINGYELRPGMYLYTLIADRQEIATKRMILTQ